MRPTKRYVRPLTKAAYAIGAILLTLLTIGAFALGDPPVFLLSSGRAEPVG